MNLELISSQTLQIVFWVAAIIVFVIVEGSTINLVSIWFAIGSVFAVLVAAFGGGFWTQALVFLVVSAVALIFTRPIVKKYLKPDKVRTNADRVLDEIGIVTVPVDNMSGTGVVKIGGIEWTARSETDEVIAEGEQVRILRIEGVKVFVTPLKEKATV